ncbi:glycerophosphodiester phosphodiesterase family protein [Kandleria sp.]|jgi:glycerophosphoryl diester phosphodiesterase|uniref:glycerophosphodiester phosphodiesterase n=1 Tax=Kandleria sp. TaxID=2774291 RepID=UPI000E9F3B49|nr:glycerophosphodiester phosphodiesterase family protein [Kandleria sp.]MBP3276743.1 hypothetical protein [Kandleria sp.]HBG68399.1 hypothetical protein [Kandleria vitulina]HCY53840.1 hypothetical protein [Kandleria vitulina]
MKKVFPHPTFKNIKIKSLGVGETINIKPLIRGPEGEMEADIHYKSDMSDILSVDQEGNVTGLKEGYGEILAFACGKLARLPLHVANVPSGIKQVTGHRGLRGLAVENTMPSFKLAAKHHVDFIETDIAITKDHQLVLFHDVKSMKRLTEEERPVNDLTLEEVKKVKFTAGNHLEDYPDVSVPTLDEYLDFMETTSSYPMIELKDPQLKDHEELLIQIRDKVDAHGFSDHVRITSASMDNLFAYEKINKNHELWIIVEEPLDDIELLKAHQWNYSVKKNACKKDFVKQVHDAGLKTDVWIINDKKEAKDFLDWPITSMTSDVVIMDEAVK